MALFDPEKIKIWIFDLVTILRNIRRIIIFACATFLLVSMQLLNIISSKIKLLTYNLFSESR